MFKDRPADGWFFCLCILIVFVSEVGRIDLRGLRVINVNDWKYEGPRCSFQ